MVDNYRVNGKSDESRKKKTDSRKKLIWGGGMLYPGLQRRG